MVLYHRALLDKVEVDGSEGCNNRVRLSIICEQPVDNNLFLEFTFWEVVLVLSTSGWGDRLSSDSLSLFGVIISAKN